jgi:peptide deformylase
MAVLPIRISGDPVLHVAAEPVAEISEEIRALVADMFETMEAAPGVGLAAPQVGVALRIFVFGWTDDDGVEHRGTAINPQLWIAPVPVGEPDEDTEQEGCLSFPGERFALKRSPQAILTATDLDGTSYEVRADGWLARIFQHEYDHLDGILYLDRLIHPLSKAAAKAQRKHGWGEPGHSWLPGVDHLED